jgi:cell division protein FtsW
MNKLKEFFTQELPPYDSYFFWIVIILSVAGFFLFVSASLGVLAKNESKFYAVLVNQIVLGFVGGGILLYITSRMPYQFWKKNAFYIFILSIILMILVFVPGLGYEHNGARRWIEIGPVSFQPSEFLKFAIIVYFSAWLSWAKKKGGSEFAGRVIPFLILLIVASTMLYFQRDTKTFILIAVAGSGMLLSSGIALRKIITIIVIIILGFGFVIGTRSYARDRIMTFFNSSNDPQGAGFQITNSKIAIGSGGLTGRGFGKSVQKFSYLPEPQGDSVFAVTAEELGFIGTTLLVLLYVAFAIRGLKIALGTKDSFAEYLVVGIVCLIIAQSFMNIGSITGLIPLTGVPLVFVSHGGTSLALALFMSGIILSISREKKK